MPGEGKTAAEQVGELKTFIVKRVNSLLECIHLRQADQCELCRGRTASTAMMEEVLEELRAQGLVAVELAVELTKGREQPISHRRQLKTLIGIGIGVSFFIGLVGWQGGKLVWRLIAKKNAKSS